MIINLFIRQRKSYVKRNIHAAEAILISSNFETKISANFSVSKNRNFLFESFKECHVSLFHHVIDFYTNEVIVRNDSFKTVKILKNFYLKSVTEMSYDDCFQLNTNELHRAVKSLKSNWIKDIKETTSLFASFVKVDSVIFQSTMTNIDTFSQQFEDSQKVKLSNEVMIYENNQTITIYNQLINEFSSLWRDEDFIDISKENWMKFFLRKNWQFHVTEKFKVYFLSLKNQKVINDTFDEFHEKRRLEWITSFISFSYSIFVTWRTVNEIRKDRAVINIRGLKKLLLSDVYSLFLQSDIISNLQNCTHISIFDAASFFYQWRTHSDDVYKQTVITFRDQEIFLILVMSNRNSVFYVQRQMNHILKNVRHFAKAFIDDIVIKFRSFNDHVAHLRKIFSIFCKFNISIKSTKVFLNYSNVVLLRQRVNVLRLSTTDEKLKIIAEFKFSNTLKNLKHYFDLTKYIRDHIYYYFAIIKFLQDLKIALLKKASNKNHKRKQFTSKIKILLTQKKLLSFEIFQEVLSKSSMLYHFVAFNTLWVNLDTFKEFEIDVVIFHFKENIIIEKERWSFKTQILSIMFLSRQLIFAKLNYWSTELKTSKLVWIIKKIRHLVQSSQHRIIVQTDHQTIVNICEQTLITFTNFTIRMNVRLIRISQFLSQFNLDVRYKSNKDHIIFDALFKLASININQFVDKDHAELNVLFANNSTLVKMSTEFYNKIIEKYFKNSMWKKIRDIIQKNETLEENATSLFFSTRRVSSEIDPYMKSRSKQLIALQNSKSEQINALQERLSQLIYHSDNLIDLHRLCISTNCVQNIFEVAHDEEHSSFARCFEIIFKAWYIKNLIKQFKNYIKHCFDCLILQTRRHNSYDDLQLIDFSSVSFHTLTLNFILALSLSVKF